MISNSGTVVCPDCGDRVELTITLGPPAKGEGVVEVSVSVSSDFRQRFEQHVLADPAGHPQFVSSSA